MLHHLLSFYAKHQLDRSGTVVVGVSGGKDSMSLLNCFLETEIPIAVAHMNFSLRGEEAVHDADFVKNWCDERKIPVYIKEVKTHLIARELGLSVQMAARQLRYSWFHDLKSEANARYIALAHHADDQLETILINLIKGYSPKLMAGMRGFTDPIIRPFIKATRAEINDYAESRQILYQEDASNADTKYLRNNVRHWVVPILKEMEPEILDGVIRNSQILQDVFAGFADHLERIKGDYLKEVYGVYSFELEKMRSLPGGDALVFNVLREFGFDRSHFLALKGWSDGKWPDAGKYIETDTHRIYFYHPVVWIEPSLNPKKALTIDWSQKEIQWYNQKIRIKPTEYNADQLNPNACFIPIEMTQDASVVLRNPEDGDKIKPFNFKGSKQVSDLLKEAKIPIPLRKRVPVLVAGNKVYWVAGHRLADLNSIAKPGQKGYLAELLKEG